MSDTIGNGINRRLVDSDGDALDDGAGKLRVETFMGSGPTIGINSFDEVTVGTSAVLLSSSDGINNVSVAKEIIFQAQYANTGYIMIGDNEVTAASNGIALYGGDTFIFRYGQPGSIYIRGSASGQKINIMCTY